ncbi:MAG: hypothetical protein Athens071426_608 [Parcubacteria group bacterium Athens0714_26]|nr:MAG: hypothetical protein Athens101426_439 [Parcubacteria group bacterium Athens1014_26]TSD01912.1 MAG: hypothetical protein Athens071426_608 [Parcubacteria group bacterium Athens0714_26]
MADKNNKIGIAALPTILILGSIIIDVVIVMTLGMNLLVNSGYGVRLSNEALAAAKAGAQDGMLRVSRDKNFNSNYQLTVGSRTVDVVVCKDLPECGGVGKYKISSTATALTKKKKIEVILVVDPITGVVQLQSLKEVAL